MSTLPENSGQGEISKFFGMDASMLYSTAGGQGSPVGTGSPGIGDATESGPPLARVTVTIPGMTSQGPQPSLVVGSDDTETPAAAGLYNRTERISGVKLDRGGDGFFQPNGMKPFLANQAVDHPNSAGPGRAP